MQKNILLIGMPAVGKSTYGKLLAKELKIDFVDSDDVVEALAGESCANIVRDQGQNVFAQYESQALLSLASENMVIATGGSAIYRDEIQPLAKKSLVIHLYCRSKTLEKRIGSVGDRGVIFPEKMSFTNLYKQRMPLYKELSDIEFSTDSKKGNLIQVGKHLVELVKNTIESQKTDIHWMNQALAMAKQAEKDQEVPVGAIVVIGGEKVGEGRNRSISLHDSTAHAEIIAIREANKNIENYRLPNATLYVTLEPCSMCAGAIIQSRIGRVVYAASDPKAGAVESVFSLLSDKRLNHRCEISSGVLQKESSELLKNFFKSRR